MKECADIVLLNGNVITVDSENTRAEAVAIKSNIILRVGTTAEVEEHVGDDTGIVDVGGRAILPGFIDAHTHSQDYATNLKYRALIHAPPMKSVRDVKNLVRERAREVPEGEWIVCWGSFHLDHKYLEKRYPTRGELDEAAPNHPVAMFSGPHIAILNSKALEVSGVTRDTPKHVILPGKVALVEKDPETGEPTGVIREAGALLPLPKYGEEEVEEAMRDILFRGFTQKGITTVHDMPGPDAFRIYQRWMAEGEMPFRVLVYFYMPRYGGDIAPLLNFGFQSGFGNDWLKLGGIKLMVDGGITGPKASLYQPFPHDVYDYGLLNYSQEELTRIYVDAQKAGLQVMSHTTGEKAQDMVMNAIQAALFESPNEDHRHRLEHAGNYFATHERMERMLELGAIPVVNPQFIHAFGFLMEHFYGRRVRGGLFPFRMLLDMGFRLPFSSDCTGTQPEATNPLWGIWCAVKRESYDGSILDPAQRISVMDAIRCYTLYAAMAGFEEDTKGSIESGKLADLIVLSEDPLSVSVDEIKDIKVVMTIVNGKIVYKDAGMQAK